MRIHKIFFLGFRTKFHEFSIFDLGRVVYGMTKASKILDLKIYNNILGLFINENRERVNLNKLRCMKQGSYCTTMKPGVIGKSVKMFGHGKLQNSYSA